MKTSERPIAEVARSLEIAEGTLWNWVKLARDAGTRGADPDALSESERDELRRLRKENIELQTDKEILRRAAAHFCPGDDALIRLQFVSDSQAELPVTRMCELVGLPRSSFYWWRTHHTPSARDIADAELLETIRDIYRRSRDTYGAPRIYGQLRRTSHRVAKSRVARLMRTNDLVGAHSRKKWRRGRLGLRWIVEATNSWLSNYGQLRRNTDRRLRHRHAALCLAVTILIVIKLIAWRDRYTPDCRPIR